MTPSHHLDFVFSGWDGYHKSLVEAFAPLTTEQLEFRGDPEMPSVGELGWHIADGRVGWFRRMDVPLGDELRDEMKARQSGGPDPMSAELIVRWLERTWEMVLKTLNAWTVEDLAVCYPHEYQGKTYSVSRQWTVYRILTHDIHHGGQLSELLALQKIYPLELTLLGGHLAEPELWTGPIP